MSEQSFVMNSTGRLRKDKLQALGLEVITPEITEILKGGGGPHCMTFPLYRDA